MERETGFEPATSYLEGRHSATELLPLGLSIIKILGIFYFTLAKSLYQFNQVLNPL
jgi:hypothetical protein